MAAPYQLYTLHDPQVTELHADGERTFLIVRGVRPRTGRPWTLVFERQKEYWISRRDVTVDLDPGAAVSGFLFNREAHQDPLEILRRTNEVTRVEYYKMLQEKLKGDRDRQALTEALSRLERDRDRLQRQLFLRDERSESGRVPASRRGRAARRSRKRRPT